MRAEDFEKFERSGFTTDQAKVILSFVDERDKRQQNELSKHIFDKILETQEKIAAGDRQSIEAMHELDKNSSERMLALDKKIDERMHVLDKKIDERIHNLDKKIDAGVHALDKKFEERFHNLDKKIDEKIHALEVRLYFRLGGMFTVTIAVLGFLIRMPH